MACLCAGPWLGSMSTCWCPSPWLLRLPGLWQQASGSILLLTAWNVPLSQMHWGKPGFWGLGFSQASTAAPSAVASVLGF